MRFKSAVCLILRKIDVSSAIKFATCQSRAGIAQLVERNLAKVEVASSNLVSRSNIFLWIRVAENRHLNTCLSVAGWQRGYAAACKAVYAGSNPTPASKLTDFLSISDASPGGEIWQTQGT